MFSAWDFPSPPPPMRSIISSTLLTPVPKPRMPSTRKTPIRPSSASQDFSGASQNTLSPFSLVFSTLSCCETLSRSFVVSSNHSTNSSRSSRVASLTSARICKPETFKSARSLSGSFFKTALSLSGFSNSNGRSKATTVCPDNFPDQVLRRSSNSLISSSSSLFSLDTPGNRSRNFFTAFEFQSSPSGPSSMFSRMVPISSNSAETKISAGRNSSRFSLVEAARGNRKEAMRPKK